MPQLNTMAAKSERGDISRLHSRKMAYSDDDAGAIGCDISDFLNVEREELYDLYKEAFQRKTATFGNGLEELGSQQQIKTYDPIYLYDFAVLLIRSPYHTSDNNDNGLFNLASKNFLLFLEDKYRSIFPVQQKKFLFEKRECFTFREAQSAIHRFMCTKGWRALVPVVIFNGHGSNRGLSFMRDQYRTPHATFIRAVHRSIDRAYQEFCDKVVFYQLTRIVFAQCFGHFYDHQTQNLELTYRVAVNELSSMTNPSTKVKYRLKTHGTYALDAEHFQLQDYSVSLITRALSKEVFRPKTPPKRTWETSYSSAYEEYLETPDILQPKYSEVNMSPPNSRQGTRLPSIYKNNQYASGTSLSKTRQSDAFTTTTFPRSRRSTNYPLSEAMTTPNNGSYQATISHPRARSGQWQTTYGSVFGKAKPNVVTDDWRTNVTRRSRKQNRDWMTSYTRQFGLKKYKQL